MKGTPDCLPCLLRQTLVAARQVADDPWLHRKVLNEAMGHLQKAELDRAPAELVSEVQRLAARVLGSPDTFAGFKDRHRNEARVLEESLRARIAASAAPLREALYLAAAANAADAAVFGDVSFGDFLRTMDAARVALDDSERVVADAAEAKTVLYLCDNAGEVLVDRLVIELLVAEGKAVTCVVRRGPVANEATREDAAWAKLEEVCTLVDAGVAGSGFPLALVSKEARDCFDGADLVIAKGSANYETLDGEPKRKYCLMCVKCGVVAHHLGVSQGDVVILGD